MIPPGFVKVDHRLPKKGEWVLFGNSIIKAPWNYISLTMDILAPDNIPSGWEFVDYRPLKEDDWYLWTGGMLYQCACTPSDQSEKYVIVQRKQKETKEMAIPYGFVKGETRLPKAGEWFLEKLGPEKAFRDFSYRTMLIIEPKDIPSGWEFVDYRVPKDGERFLWVPNKPVQRCLGTYEEKVVIVREKPKVKPPAETLLEEISKLSYTPPPSVPETQTPASSYGASALKTISENLTKNGWEVIGFRRLAKGDLYVYDPFGLDIRTYPDPTNLNWPALIVRKRRVITDTERLDYFLGECAMFENREEIDEEILAVEREDRGE